MSKPTEHGENIANQIQDEDAYGASDDLTAADLWNILDQLHSHFMHVSNSEKLLEFCSRWINELEDFDPSLLDYI